MNERVEGLFNEKEKTKVRLTANTQVKSKCSTHLLNETDQITEILDQSSSF